MRPIHIALWGLLATLTAFWFLQPQALPDSMNIMAIRNVLKDYSGIMAISAMSATMILASRFKWIEPWLNGLDKSYRLHKWLGITALITAFSHWVIVSGPGWARDLGLMEPRGRRGPPPGAQDGSMGVIEAFLDSLRDPAEGLGEKAFYIAAILMVLALVKYFPYKRFFKTHTILAIAYLVLVFHSIVLFPFELWGYPLGILVGLLMLGGTISAVRILARTHGKAQEAKGYIARLVHRPDMQTLNTTLKVDKDWKGHKAGQFAFVSFNKKEGKHPFTMASHWDETTREITFMTKALGDYTAQMPDILKEGDPVTIEGPYGCFTFDDDRNSQIWVGAGIGITPFLARMKQLAGQHSNQMVDLFHVTSAITPDMERELRADAKAANIKLHLITDQDGTGFSAEKLRELVPGWAEASVWFCGPSKMGKMLKQKLSGQGLKANAFHQEAFEMR